ncbi:MAG TPA: DUF1616 domain-containing protein [Candidatus Thermoplasmatota archaeon]|nr:DUF1616 domain-containing protein [Candidatus Thermoplasmatota archaeon]
MSPDPLPQTATAPAPRRNATSAPVDLVAVAVAGLLAMAAVLLRLDPWRLALGWLLPVLLPGYAFVAWLYPARRGNAACARCLGAWERAALGVVASVALTIVTGVALNFLPSGITLATMAYGLGILTLAFLVLAANSRLALVADDRPVFAWRTAPAGGLARTGLGMGALLAVSFVGLLVAVVAFPVAPAEDSYSSLYLLGAGGKPQCLPSLYTEGEFRIRAPADVTCPAFGGNVTIGVVNHEHKTVAYRMQVFWSDPTATDIAASVSTAHVATLDAVLAPMPTPNARSGHEQQHEHAVPLSPPPAAGAHRLNVHLFKDLGSGFPPVADQYLYFYVDAT